MKKQEKKPINKTIMAIIPFAIIVLLFLFSAMQQSGDMLKIERLKYEACPTCAMMEYLFYGVIFAIVVAGVVIWYLKKSRKK